MGAGHEEEAEAYPTQAAEETVTRGQEGRLHHSKEGALFEEQQQAEE